MKKTNQSNTMVNSRRNFLRLSGGLTFGILSAPYLKVFGRSEEEFLSESYSVISAWVHIATDNTIRIFSPASEMGQGSMTSLAAILAEEMDADWSLVRAEHSPVDPKTFGLTWGGDLGGSMITVGSRTIRGYYKNLRMAGAQVRAVLIREAARKMNVGTDSLRTENSHVIHDKSGQQLSFGEIAQAIKSLPELPQVSADDLKDPGDFRIIGTDLGRQDIPAKVDGSAQYAMDVFLPAMVYGMIERAPSHGAKPILRNEMELSDLPGFVGIVKLDHGIGVVAKTIEEALGIKAELQLDWDNSQATKHDSEKAWAQYESEIDSGSPERILYEKGDASGLILNGKKKFFARYKNDHVHHCQMEPLNAVVSIAEDGKSADVWAGSQFPDGAREEAAKALGLRFEQVNYHPCYLGGGFGRRSLADYVVEACQMAKEIGKPLKLIWTKDDDMRYGHMRPQSMQQLEASLDESGKIEAWKYIVTGAGGGLLSSGAEIPFYNIENQHIEQRSLDLGIRTKHWRAVGHGPNKWAIEAFIDEIAHELGRDPLEYRLQMMDGQDRAKAVLLKAAEMASWGSTLAEDRARGIAFAERSGSLSAGVCEISVDRDSGEIRVHKFWAAVDAGVVIDRDNVIAQMEGAILMGMSSVLRESMTFRDGVIVQNNYHSYPILRISEIPELLDVDIIDSEVAPTGVGESGLPIVGGAIANAFLALTGKKIRHIPFRPEKVLEAMES